MINKAWLYEWVDNNINKKSDIYIVKIKDKKVKNDYYKLVEIQQMFLNNYEQLFKKMYKTYYDDIKKILNELLNDIDISNSNDINAKYYNELNSDLKILYNLYNDPFYRISSLTTLYYSQYLKKYKDDDNSLYHAVINELAKHFFKEDNESLYFKNVKRYEKLIDEDPLQWNKLKNNIYCKKILNKFEYLEDANKFDLI